MSVLASDDILAAGKATPQGHPAQASLRWIEFWASLRGAIVIAVVLAVAAALLRPHDQSQVRGAYYALLLQITIIVLIFWSATNFVRFRVRQLHRQAGRIHTWGSGLACHRGESQIGPWLYGGGLIAMYLHMGMRPLLADFQSASAESIAAVGWWNGTKLFNSLVVALMLILFYLPLALRRLYRIEVAENGLLFYMDIYPWESLRVGDSYEPDRYWLQARVTSEGKELSLTMLEAELSRLNCPVNHVRCQVVDPFCDPGE